jgi:hypothetical protein
MRNWGLVRKYGRVGGAERVREEGDFMGWLLSLLQHRLRA